MNVNLLHNGYMYKGQLIAKNVIYKDQLIAKRFYIKSNLWQNGCIYRLTYRKTVETSVVKTRL